MSCSTKMLVNQEKETNEDTEKKGKSTFSVVPLIPAEIEKKYFDNMENYITMPLTEKGLQKIVNKEINEQRLLQEKINKIERISGKKEAKIYKELSEKISRHKLLIDALDKSASLSFSGVKIYTFGALYMNEKKNLYIWKKKMEEIERNTLPK